MIALKGMFWLFVICILLCFLLSQSVSLFYNQLANYSKIMTITSLKMDFMALADSPLECSTNYYKDGNECKGIKLFED